MPCPGRGTFTAYADGTLPSRIKREVASHAKRCPACRLYLAEALNPERDETLPGAPPVADPRSAPAGRGRASTSARTMRVQRRGLLDGKYELLEQISQGGMARVFRGRHHELGRHVAVKLVLDGFREDRRMRELFFSEARIASSLSHPHIAAVTDFGVDERLGYFLVMDLLEGETLRERMRRQWPPLRLAAELLDQVTGAVRYIHERGIVHCDLKPENIFLSHLPSERASWNHVKLIDFGLSFRVDQLPDSEVAGTVPYLAPERMEGAPPSPSCDVYSLGVLLYELIARRRPYQGEPADVMVQQRAGVVPPPPSEFAVEHVDERVDALVLRAMAPDPAERHASAEAFHFELRTWMTMRGLRSPRAPRVNDRSAPVDAGALSVSAEVMESPVPLAVFAPSGELRFGNAAFFERAEGAPSARTQTFAELQIARRDPSLVDAFEQTVGMGAAQRRPVTAFTAARTAGLLLLIPAMRRNQVDGVHVTWLDSDADGD